MMAEERITVAPGVELPATLVIPDSARALVVFAHGAGSSRLSPRNVAVASALRETGRFGTLLFDLLTADEDRVYENRFDIDLLSARLAEVCRHVSHVWASGMPLGLFGASTGAAAALKAAVLEPAIISSIVSRGGRPDLAGDALPMVTAPTLLIVGGADTVVLALNRAALASLPATTPTELAVVHGATHLFEEPGALEEVTRLGLEWFERTLKGPNE